MKDSDSQSTHKVAEKIVEYLRRHPRAADTLEGIVDWWLLVAGEKVSASTVEDALEMLASDGQILVERQQDSSAIYKLSPKAKREGK